MNKWPKGNEARSHGACTELPRLQICCLRCTLGIPEVCGIRSPIICMVIVGPVRMMMKRGYELVSFLPLSLFVHPNVCSGHKQLTPFHLIFPGKRRPVKMVSVMKREMIFLIVMLRINSFDIYKNPPKIRVRFLEISSFETYLKILGEPLLVIRIELPDVFNKLFDRNGFHVICRNKMILRVT